MRFFNDKAYDVCVWSYEEKDRVKASHIYKAALRMEASYRMHHRIHPNTTCLVSPYMIEHPKSEVSAKIEAQFPYKHPVYQKG